MIDYVFAACKENNLNVLITSADGQWHNYGVRDNKNKPLTILQLQRDVWATAKSKQKSGIVQELKEIHAVDFTTFEQHVVFEKEVGRIQVHGHLLYRHVPTLRPALWKLLDNTRETTRETT
jgi:hypothetical protein